MEKRIEEFVKIVIFVLSAQNDCFLLGHENEFLVETSNSFEFFLQPHFKIFEFLNFSKIFLGC
jgi:hypothetical protein